MLAWDRSVQFTGNQLFYSFCLSVKIQKSVVLTLIPVDISLNAGYGSSPPAMKRGHCGFLSDKRSRYRPV